MQTRNIYIVGSGKMYASWMKATLIVDNLDIADLIVFTGGEDVNPILYGENKHPRTSYNINRDTLEKKAYDAARKLGIPMIGICRGAQFLTVMNNGKLVQHQDNISYHSVETFDEKSFIISSSHHQAMFPWELPKDNFKVIAWTNGISDIHQDGDQLEMTLPDNKECEIVYYPKTQCLGIQGHPEWMERGVYPKTFEYLDDLLNKFLEDKLIENE